MGKGSTGPSSDVTSGMAADQSALAQLVNQQTKQSSQLYNLTEPGLVQSENFFETLASGDPGAIMRAIAPTAQAESSAAAGAKSNIMANAPAGGEKNLALEEVDVNRAAGIAKTASGASLTANDSLGKLASQGIGESQQGASIASGALGTSLSGFSSLGGMELQGQQIQAQEKGQTLGAVGGLLGDTAGALCPCRGSLILMADGKEKPIECIRIGDRKRCQNGEDDTITDIVSGIEESVRVTTGNGRILHSSLSHTYISPDNDQGFSVAFESYGQDVVMGDGSGMDCTKIVDVRPCGLREVFSIKSDRSPTYRADGVWALGVGDERSDEYIDLRETRARMRALISVVSPVLV